MVSLACCGFATRFRVLTACFCLIMASPLVFVFFHLCHTEPEINSQLRMLSFGSLCYHQQKHNYSRTSLLLTVSYAPTDKISHMFSLNKTSIIPTTDTKYWPQRANTYKLNLFITDTLYYTIDFLDILLKLLFAALANYWKTRRLCSITVLGAALHCSQCLNTAN